MKDHLFFKTTIFFSEPEGGLSRGGLMYVCHIVAPNMKRTYSWLFLKHIECEWGVCCQITCYCTAGGQRIVCSAAWRNTKHSLVYPTKSV